jgi:hypothetical protein
MGLDTSNPLSKTRMTIVHGNTPRRVFFKNYNDAAASSDWVNLTEGEKYYVEASHLEGSGGDHMSVGVEIEMANSTGYHHAMREV